MHVPHTPQHHRFLVTNPRSPSAGSWQIPSLMWLNLTSPLQVPDRCHLGCEHQIRPERSLPGTHHPTHRWQRLWAYHSCPGGLQEQDGPGYWSSSGVFNPDCHLCAACAGSHWVSCLCWDAVLHTVTDSLGEQSFKHYFWRIQESVPPCELCWNAGFAHGDGLIGWALSAVLHMVQEIIGSALFANSF